MILRPLDLERGKDGRIQLYRRAYRSPFSQQYLRVFEANNPYIMVISTHEDRVFVLNAAGIGVCLNLLLDHVRDLSTHKSLIDCI